MNRTNFIINPYYQTQTTELTSAEIDAAIEVVLRVIAHPGSDPKITKLIGVGNDAAGKVYSLIGTKFCLKIAALGKHVGKNQELQFKLNDECRKAIANKKVNIEGNDYYLICIPAVAVAVDDKNAYTLMIRHDNTLRLWDEENIPFTDKDNWPAIGKIKAMMRRYGRKEFLKSMDINGNNLLVDIDKKLIYLIDPYVPQE